MTPIYLITKADIQLYEDVPANVDVNRLHQYIYKAQELDLKPFLGTAFYYDFLQQFSTDGSLKDSATQPYRQFLNGCTYTDTAGHSIQYDGLTKMLVYFTMARFAESDAIRFTPTGPMFKQQDNGQPVRQADLAKVVQQYRSIANAYTNDVAAYLINHRSDFPLWQYSYKNASARQSGPRIRGIDRTGFNLSDYPSNYPPFNGIL